MRARAVERTGRETRPGAAGGSNARASLCARVCACEGRGDGSKRRVWGGARVHVGARQMLLVRHWSDAAPCHPRSGRACSFRAMALRTRCARSPVSGRLRLRSDGAIESEQYQHIIRKMYTGDTHRKSGNVCMEGTAMKLEVRG